MTRTGSPSPARAGTSHTALWPRLPKNQRTSESIDCRFPRTSAIQRPSGDQANECMSPPLASSTGAPPSAGMRKSESERANASCRPSGDHGPGSRTSVPLERYHRLRGAAERGGDLDSASGAEDQVLAVG